MPFKKRASFVSHIDPHVSDLFFNLDFDHCKEHDRSGRFTGWDDEKMLDEAKWFSTAIEKIGGPVCAPSDLLLDFKARV